LDAIRSFYAELTGDVRQGQRFEDGDYRLAAAALLVHLLAIDGEISPRERTRLHTVLKYRFNLDDTQTDALIRAATVVEGEAVDLYAYTQLLNRALDDEGRRRIVEMMWEMSYADGQVNEFEDNLIWRAADLLNVPSRERLALRREVGGESPASAQGVDPEPASRG